MAASHSVAGEGVEDGDHEKAGAGGDEDGVEHVSTPHGIWRDNGFKFHAAISIDAAPYKFETGRRPKKYKRRIRGADSRRRYLNCSPLDAPALI